MKTISAQKIPACNYQMEKLAEIISTVITALLFMLIIHLILIAISFPEDLLRRNYEVELRGMTAVCYFSLEEGELEIASRILIKRLHILGTSSYNRTYWYFKGRENSESNPEEDREADYIGALLKHWYTTGLVGIIKLRKQMNDGVWEDTL